MSYIQAENLIKKYGTGDSAVHALSGITLNIQSGEFISVMGQSGSGKSTLLSILGAMNNPSDGRLLVEDMDIYTLSIDQRADFRREFLGFVFQSFHLMPYLTAMENVLLPLTATSLTRHEKHSMSREALRKVGLAGKEQRLPNELSGGEKERVAIARAIVNAPPILLADEPTGNLDSATSRDIMNLLKSLNTEGMTIVMVTHNHDCAEYADRTIELCDGRLAEREMLKTIR